MQSEELPPKLKLGILISLLAYLFFITASSLVGFVSSSVSIFQILFIQNLVGLVVLAPFLLSRGSCVFKTHFLKLHLVRSFSGALSYSVYFETIRLLGLVGATALNYTAPFFVPLIWAFWMKEKVGKNVWISIVIGFVGALTILNPSTSLLDMGFFFGISAGAISGLSLCSVRVLHRKEEPLRRTLFYYFLVGTFFSAPFAFSSWQALSLSEWGHLFLIGLISVSGQALLTLAYRFGTASYLSPLGYVTVIYAGLFSYLLLGEPLGGQTVLGGALIVLGGSATYFLKGRLQKKRSSQEQADEKF